MLMLPFRRWVPAALAAGLVFLACSACGPATELTPSETAWADTVAPSPSVTAARTPLPSLTRTSSNAASTPSAGTTPTGRPTVTATPTPDAPKHLAMAREGNILVGNLRGEEPTPIAQVELADAWDLSQGRLAMAQGGLLQMIDLVHGSHWAESLDAAGTVLHANLLWGRTGRSFLVTLLMEDNDTTQMILQAVDGDTGALLRTHSLAKGVHAMALSYDDSEGAVWLALLGGKGELEALEHVSLDDTKPPVPYALRGRLPVALEAESHRLAYLSPDGASICTQAIGEPSTERCVSLPQGLAPTSYAWSRDGNQLALMLQPPADADVESPSDAGLWLLTLSDGSLRQIIAHQGPMSEVIGWAPEDEMLLARHSGGSIPDHVYLIRPDGGDRRILPGSERIVPLGWIPSRALGEAEIQLDTWLSTFASQAADAQALADTTARWLTTVTNRSDAELTQQLRQYVQASGLPLDVAGPQVWPATEGLYLVQLPPLTIYVCDEGVAYPIASGHLIQDARIEGNLLAVIYATIGASSVNPGFVLAERTAQGWQVAWTPQGQRYWIPTDGEIRFIEGSADRLLVRGSSFALEPAPGDPFRQCHACLHRWFQATWVRSANTYTLLNAESGSDDEILWTLTERTPYAVLHGALARLRNGQSAGALITPDAQSQIEALGLLDPELVLVAEEESDESVIFSDLDTGTRYQAIVRQEQVVSVGRSKS